MVKHCLIWKEVKCKSVKGTPVWLEIPQISANYYRGTLVSRIQAMPRKSPISFEAAINLVANKQIEALVAGRIGPEPDHYSWYFANLVDWISSLGFHIELTGDEFEAYVLAASLT